MTLTITHDGTSPASLLSYSTSNGEEGCFSASMLAPLLTWYGVRYLAPLTLQDRIDNVNAAIGRLAW